MNKVHADAENQFSKLEKEVRSELEEQHPVLSRVKGKSMCPALNF